MLEKESIEFVINKKWSFQPIKKYLIVIAGPTAAGKQSYRVVKIFPYRNYSADSRQILKN